MTITTIQAAGYIVCDDLVIWATGSTEDEAWHSMLDGMRIAGIKVIDDDEADTLADADDYDGWTRASGFISQPASAALIAEVNGRGGNIAWGEVDSVACTRDEEEGE